MRSEYKCKCSCHRIFIFCIFHDEFDIRSCLWFFFLNIYVNMERTERKNAALHTHQKEDEKKYLCSAEERKRMQSREFRELLLFLPVLPIIILCEYHFFFNFFFFSSLLSQEQDMRY